jgi:polyisoprenoid-binding protein YceI
MAEATTTPGTRIVDGRPVPKVGTWAIDPSHQSFEFVARRLMAKVRGRFAGVSGVATIAERPGEGATTWKVDGDLTVNGITRPVTVQVEFLGAGVDPWGNQRIGFSGVVPEVDRENWGPTCNAALETGGFLLSKSVRLEIEAELVRK